MAYLDPLLKIMDSDVLDNEFQNKSIPAQMLNMVMSEDHETSKGYTHPCSFAFGADLLLLRFVSQRRHKV
jgi:hypothetical protein